MTLEQMQKIVDGAPDSTATHIDHHGYYVRKTSQYSAQHWFSGEWSFYHQRGELIELDHLRIKIKQWLFMDLDLEPADIPHGTIVLEK